MIDPRWLWRRWRAQAAVAFVLAGIVAGAWLAVQVVRWIGELV